MMTLLRWTVGWVVAAVRRWQWARWRPPYGVVSAQWLYDHERRDGTR